MLKLIKDLGMLYPKENSKHKARFGIYLCHCGKQFKTRTADMNMGRVTKCKTCAIVKRNTTHNYSKHKLYGIWQGMMERCNNPKHIAYKRYGGRGITVCDEWLDINKFIDDMFSSYIDGLSIDRVDNNKGYSKDNCRWTTKATQARNITKLRINNTSGYKGVSLNRKNNKYIAQISVKSVIYLGSFKTALEGALAYDKYIIDNNLEHTKNF